MKKIHEFVEKSQQIKVLQKTISARISIKNGKRSKMPIHIYLDESERYGRQVGLAVLWREEGDQLTQLFRQLWGGGTRTQLGRVKDTPLYQTELF